jgi:excisionase family DNA binding protein
MATRNQKDVLTTGEVARICHVAPRTVSKWFDTGKLRGYRIPGSRDRRIPVTQLMAFMQQHGMPLDGLELGRQKLLIVANRPDEALEADLTQRGFQVQQAQTLFDAGVAAQQFQPHILLLDLSDTDAAAQLSGHIKDNQELQGIRIFLAVEDEAQTQLPEWNHCDGFVIRPINGVSVAQAIETAPVA